jgi:hypothetical protein
LFITVETPQLLLWWISVSGGERNLFGCGASLATVEFFWCCLEVE